MDKNVKVLDPVCVGVEFLGPVNVGDQILVRQTWCPYPGATHRVRRTRVEAQAPHWARTTVEYDTAEPDTPWPKFTLVEGFLGVEVQHPMAIGVFTTEIVSG